MKNFATALIFLTLSPFLFSQSSGSFGFSDARSTALALTYTSNSRGVDAIGVNPANIAREDRTRFSLKTHIPIPQINFYFRTPMSIEKYNYFFGGVDDGTGKIVGRYLNESEKEELKEMLGDTDLLFNLNANHLSISYLHNQKIGGFGFAFVDRLGVRFKPSKGFTDLIFSGLYPNQIYAFSDLIAKASIWREVSFSYARKMIDFENAFIKNLYAGITLKFISGYYYLSTEKNDSYFNHESENVIRGKLDYLILHALSPDFATNYGKDSIVSDFRFSFAPTSAGKGFGIDLGLSGDINDYIKAGIAITDLGSINWKTNQATIKGKSEFTFEGYSTKEELDSLKEKFNEATSDITSPFSSSLPTALRVGLSLQLEKAPFIKSFPGSLLVVFDYNQGFNNEIGNTTIPRFSLGFEWDYLKYIPLIRTGISVGGLVGFTWSFGLGFKLGPIEFNLASSNFASLFSPNSTRKINLAMESKWRF
jgi:hypothetical protein